MSPINLNNLKSDEREKLLNSFDTVFTDCDGVLWFASKAIRGAAEALNTLAESGKLVFYFTNNCTLSVKDFQKKCHKFGFIASKEQMLCTSWLTAHFLKTLNFKKKVYVIGPRSIEEELKLVGIDSFGYGPDAYVCSSEDAFMSSGIEIEDDVGAVVVGLDTDVTYNKLVKACTFLKNKECLFIATSSDEVTPVKRENLLVPGVAPFVKLLEVVIRRSPIIMGKPQSYAYDLVNTEKKINPEKTLMIGDTCLTDIQFGKQIGMKTLLVLSGLSTIRDVEKFEEEGQEKLVPDYIIDSIADLLPPKKEKFTKIYSTAL